MSSRIIFLLAILLLAFNSEAKDEILLLKAITEEPPNTTEGIPRPNPGMLKDNVMTVFGEPDEESRPVGNPPIYKWVYPGYVVFFEGDRVINTVVKKPNIN